MHDKMCQWSASGNASMSSHVVTKCTSFAHIKGLSLYRLYRRQWMSVVHYLNCHTNMNERIKLYKFHCAKSLKQSRHAQHGDPFMWKQLKQDIRYKDLIFKHRQEMCMARQLCLCSRECQPWYKTPANFTRQAHPIYVWVHCKPCLPSSCRPLAQQWRDPNMIIAVKKPYPKAAGHTHTHTNTPACLPACLPAQTLLLPFSPSNTDCKATMTTPCSIHTVALQVSQVS